MVVRGGGNGEVFVGGYETVQPRLGDFLSLHRKCKLDLDLGEKGCTE